MGRRLPASRAELSGHRAGPPRLRREREVRAPARYAYGLETFAESLVDILAALGAGRVSVCGHSMGASVALTLAAHHPDLVEKLLVVSPIVYGPHRGAAASIATLPILGPLLFKQVYGRAIFRRFFRERVYAKGGTFPAERIERMFATFNAPAAREAACATMLATSDTRPLVASIPRVTAPTLVAWGRDDRSVPVEHGRRLARELRRARFEVFECGHSPPEEAPVTFAKVATAFPAEQGLSMTPLELGLLSGSRERGAWTTRLFQSRAARVGGALILVVAALAFPRAWLDLSSRRLHERLRARGLAAPHAHRADRVLLAPRRRSRVYRDEFTCLAVGGRASRSQSECSRRSWRPPWGAPSGCSPGGSKGRRGCAPRGSCSSARRRRSRAPSAVIPDGSSARRPVGDGSSACLGRKWLLPAAVECSGRGPRRSTSAPS